MPTLPGKPTLSVNTVGKDVIFAWTEPENGGSHIHSYSVWVGTPLNLACEVNAEQRNCSIEMKKLLQPPHDYQICSPIYAEIKARNSLGWGESSSQTGPKIYREPFIME